MRFASIPCLFSFAAVAGCGMLGGDDDPLTPIDIQTLTLTAAPGTHGDSPVRIDLVRVDDTVVFDRLVRMESKDWFAGSDVKFIDTQPDASVLRYEVVPDTQAGPFDIELLDDVVAVLFCEVSGQHAGVQHVVIGSDVHVHVADDLGCEVREARDQ